MFILYFIKYFKLIHTIRRVYRTCGPPKQRLVRSAHDCETGLYTTFIICPSDYEQKLQVEARKAKIQQMYEF